MAKCSLRFNLGIEYLIFSSIDYDVGGTTATLTGFNLGIEKLIFSSRVGCLGKLKFNNVFNLGIENLILSRTSQETEPSRATNSFQSRNRESYPFKWACGYNCWSPKTFSFNLVIENLILSRGGHLVDEMLLVRSFNLVIENLILSSITSLS